MIHFIFKHLNQTRNTQRCEQTDKGTQMMRHKHTCNHPLLSTQLCLSSWSLIGALSCCHGNTPHMSLGEE